MENLDDLTYRLLLGLLAGYAAYRLAAMFYENGYEDGKMVGRLQGLKLSGSMVGASKSSEQYAD